MEASDDIVAEMTDAPRRQLSHVLAKVTLLLALFLGTISGAMQIWADLRQEKNAVQYSAEEFLASVAPSAASAAYNFYLPAAEQVVDGLLTQRAIVSVKIINEGTTMIARERQVSPTLPQMGEVSAPDLVILEQPLFAPTTDTQDVQIGAINIVVDRSIVPPAFVNRMVFYFLFATIKNFLLGVLLIMIVYGALARHIVALAETIGKWTPAQAPLTISRPPKLLRGTELDVLGDRVAELARTATGRIKQVEASHQAAVQSNSVLSQKSESLTQAIHERNQELIEANNRLKHLAERDALTGLHNRGSFDAFAAKVFAEDGTEQARVSAFLIDVDFFKAYNDHYGHQAGDRCLIQVAAIIRSTLAHESAIVARYGGEEFVALFVGPTPTDLAQLAEDVHAELATAAIDHQRSTIADRITVSIGRASVSDFRQERPVTLDQLISAADSALYEAKHQGRNRTVNSTFEIRERLRQSRSKAHNLLKAIDARAFEPFFQPQFDAQTGQMVGLEALVRWRRDDGTIATPQAFLPTAEKSGLLPLIDGIVLDAVGSFLETARSRGIFVPRVSLNAPRDVLMERSYVDGVISLSRETTSTIALELLETAMFDQPDARLADHLDQLRDADIELEIDDFGTGHTSIVSLMTLRPHQVKIAKELVLPMSDDVAYADIVASIIQISAALNIEVLAEGVENQKTADLLVRLGCTLQQGFHFSKPMSATAMLDYLVTPKGTLDVKCAQ